LLLAVEAAMPVAVVLEECVLVQAVLVTAVMS